MKYRVALFEQLKSQPYFEKAAVRQLSMQYGLKTATVDTYISQTLKRREIYALRKGLYVSADFYHAHKHDMSYRYYLANVVRRPSYISSWSALQHYNLATEVIHTTTSVTTKTTRDYTTKVGDFAYQSVQARLFTGFALEKGTFNFFIASPAKALFDLLYFRTRQFTTAGLEQVDALVDDLRIDIDEIDDRERQEFYTLIKRYTRHG